jgi:dynactin-6
MDIDQDNLDIEGSRIGNNNIVESRARIVGSTSVGNYCVIGSGCSTESNETIPDLTIIYGFQSKRRNQSEPLAVTYIAPFFLFQKIY